MHFRLVDGQSARNRSFARWVFIASNSGSKSRAPAAAQQQAQAQAAQSNYDRAYGACMGGREYQVR